MTQFHVDEKKQSLTDICFNVRDLTINNQSDMMEIDEISSFRTHKMIDRNEKIHTDISFNRKYLKIGDQYDIMEVDDKSFESYEIIDLNSRKILDHFLSVYDFNNDIVVIDQILN